MIRIKRTKIAFEDEPFLAPFGFKGGYLNGAWQTVALMESENGRQGLGLGTQSILWSDAEVFLKNPEKIGNEMMYRITEEALRLAADESAHSDKDALARIEMGYGAIALKPIAGHPLFKRLPCKIVIRTGRENY